MKYNDRLQPEDAPVSTRAPRIDGVSADYRYGRGAITQAAIQDRTITSEKFADAVSIGTINNAYVGTPYILGGTIDNSTIGTALLIAGTFRNSIIGTPSISAGTWSNAQLIGTPQITGGTVASAVVNNPTIGTQSSTGGTLNSVVIGTPQINSGTASNIFMGGTPSFTINSGSAALAANGNFAVQTYAGSAVLVVRHGGTTFYFASAGTIA